MQEHLQVDLLDYLSGMRPLGQLYRWLERLPAWGHYKTALVMDEEWARYVVDQEEAGQGTPPGADTISPLGYSPVIARLDLIADRVMAIRTAVQASYAEKHEEPRFDTLPRPETALDRERERRTRSLLDEIDRMITGEGLSLTFE